MPSILIVDDEVGIRELLSEILSDEGFDISVAENAAAARAQRNKERPDLVLLDIWMPDSDGISLLKEWSAAGQLNMPVIMMSGHGTIDTAVEATRIGAIDYLEKPIALQKLLGTVKRGLENRHGQESTRVSPLTLAAFPRSGVLKDLAKRLGQISLRAKHVLFRVQGGSVAELAARSLTTRREHWLDLGSITGPIDLDQLNAAQGGVLFIEELSRLSRLQQKNLAFTLDRLERYDLHLAAASASTADELIAQGWDTTVIKRLFEVSLAIPTLDELRDDIPDLANQLLVHLVESGEVPNRKFDTGALNALRTRAWSGGYAQLRGAVRSLALGTLDEEITGEDVQRLLSPAPVTHGLPLDLPLREAREAFERVYFEHHLQLEGGNMTRLAEKTGLERTHLYRKLKQLGIQSGRRSEERSG